MKIRGRAVPITLLNTACRIYCIYDQAEGIYTFRVTGYGIRVVQRLLPDQWRLLQALRLEGILEQVGREHSDYRAEAEWDEITWRSMIATNPHFVACMLCVPVGVASLELEEDMRAEITFLWVKPNYRPAHVTDALRAAAIDWVDREGYRAGDSLRHLPYGDLLCNPAKK